MLGKDVSLPLRNDREILFFYDAIYVEEKVHWDSTTEFVDLSQNHPKAVSFYTNIL